MSKIKDGGPAFPVICTDSAGFMHAIPGMSLRDWFAGQALAGLCADPKVDVSAAVVAAAAYKCADRMLAARQKTEG